MASPNSGGTSLQHTIPAIRPGLAGRKIEVIKNNLGEGMPVRRGCVETDFDAVSGSSVRRPEETSFQTIQSQTGSKTGSESKWGEIMKRCNWSIPCERIRF